MATENGNEAAIIRARSSLFSSIIDGAVSIYQTERTVRANEKRDQKQREFEKELEELRHCNQQQLQLEAFTRQKQLQQELATYNRQTELDLAAEQRKTALESVEARKLFENWPLRIVPSLILDSHRGDAPIPLRVIPVSPVIDFDQFATNAGEFPPIEKYLAEGLRQFLHQNYSLNDIVRPVELLDGAWDSNRYHGGSSIKALFSMLQSEPILILESEIDGDYLNLRLGYWGLGQKNYSYTPVITRLPFREIIYESAKTRAKNWQTARDKILALEQDPKLINELDSYNLEILEQETAFQEAGIDTSQLPCRYKVNNQDFEVFAQFLVNCNRLVAGWIADAHHLIQNNVTPLLPQLLPELAGEAPKEIIQSILSGYSNIYQFLESERLEVMPELLLKFAHSLNALPDKSWARSQVDDSVKSWLKLRGTTFSEGTNVINAMQPLLVPSEDKSYVENVRECLTVIGDDSAASQLHELLSAKEIAFKNAENHYQSALTLVKQADHQGAIAALDQAISLNPNEPKFQNFRNELIETYYQSALTLVKQADYQGAIAALNQAISLNPHEPKFQNFREQLSKSVGSYQFDVITVNSQGKEIKREQKEAQYFSEDLGNSVTLDLVAIPGGTFMMGSPEGEGYDDEKPQHRVTVPPFFMGKYPITQAQYKQVMGKNPSHFQGDQRPVETVSWDDAVEFCQRLSKQTGKEYRLPTEAEWEYACRAGTTTPFHFGENITDKLANYGNNVGETTSVGQFPSNVFGLYDMHGNVSEWCEDNWHNNYQGASNDGTARVSEKSSTKVNRGGSWLYGPGDCRSATRSINARDNRSYAFGFRVVCVVPRTT